MAVTPKLTILELRKLAESDLFTFARLVNPMRLYGDIHQEMFRWLQKEEENLNQLLLMPRAHMKSHCLAVWCAWWITKHPETSILYLSATAELAESQLYDIKNIMTSKVYTKYWPEMIAPEEGKREKWSTTAMSVDHPKRKEEGIRDHTIKTAGLTTNTTGWHADIIVPDDVVVPDNAYTEEGRTRVSRSMSQMVSIRNAGGMTKACGTRYHPLDIYGIWKELKLPTFNDQDEIIGEQKAWTVFERVVEEENIFLWPRAFRTDGKAFGFDVKTLASVKAGYLDKTQFFAQYYNNPNDEESNRIDRNTFQYFNREKLRKEGRRWSVNGQILNIYASIDFAFSLSKAADYTAIVVIGVTANDHVYVLDIDRFKTNSIAEYYKRIAKLHAQWDFKQLRAEVTAGQSIIVNELKKRLREEGLALPVKEFRPPPKTTKEERIAAIIEPRYESMLIWHYKGGYTELLEEEVVLARPRHDDIKDALASAIEIALPPKRLGRGMRTQRQNLNYNPRFGGISR